MSFFRLIRPSHILLFFLLFSVHANAIDDENGAASVPSLIPSGFWLSTELLSVTFLKGCLSTALCHQPAFKLVHTMTLNGQKSAMSWPVDGGGAEMLQDRHLRQFVSHWTVGDPEDVSVACQIAGTDPSFGFARVCDETSARRVFQEAMVRRTVMQNSNANIDNSVRTKRRDGASALPRPPSVPTPPPLSADNGQQHYAHQMVVEMRGRCFNATLAVRGHLSRCPWCPDPNVHIHVDGADGGIAPGVDGRGNDAQHQQQLNSADSLLLLHNIVILALSGAVVFAVTGLCAVFVAQRRHRQNKKQQNKTTGGGRRESGGKGAGGVSSTLTMIRGVRHERGKKRAKKLLSPPRAQQPLPVPPQDGEGREQQQTMIVYGGGSRRIGTGEEHEEEEERYDTPWDNKYCLVPRQWLFDGNGSACGMAPPPPPTAPLQAADAAWQFRHPPIPLQRPSPFDHSSYPCDTSSKYATCANFGGAVAAQTKSPMMGMLCSQRTQTNGQQQFYGTMPTAELQQQSPLGLAITDQSSAGARAAVPDQPPPPPPPIALLPARHAQPKHVEKGTFTSPNTSSSSGSTNRHDDSGLDSV